MGTFDEVEVCNTFGDWTAGFEVADVELAASGVVGFWLRRQSDGTVLPTTLPADRIRPAHPDPPYMRRR